MKLKKRIAAMGAAVMMMSSMAIGASAADSFSFYISNTGSVTSKVIAAGNAAQDDYVGSTTELTISQMLHPFPIEQRLEVHILQVEKYQVKETILRNTLMRHILIKVNVFCAQCHSIQLRQV